MSFLTITAVVVFTALFAILFKTGFKQINILASTPHGNSQDHDSPEKSSRRKQSKGKRHVTTEHAAASNQRNIENPDR